MGLSTTDRPVVAGRLARAALALTVGTAMAVLPAAALAGPTAGSQGGSGPGQVAPVDVVVLADESGSLSAEAIQSERDAASLIAQSELSSHSLITVFGFGSANSAGQSPVDPVCPTTEIRDDLARASLTRCVAGIHARSATEGNDTDHVNALRAALGALPLTQNDGRAKVVFLLTDGTLDVPNSPAYGPNPAERNAEAQRQLDTQVLPQARGAGVQIWPLGFGAADRERLDAFAAGGGQVGMGCGSAAAGPPPSEVITDEGQVAAAVLRAFATARCAVLSPSQTRVLDPGTSVDLGLDIPVIATDGSIVVNKVDARSDVSYRDPQGRTVAANGSFDGSTFSVSGQGGPLEALHITDPRPGHWTVHISAPAQTARNTVSASVLWQGAVSSAVVVDPATPHPGQPVAVHVRLSRRSGVVLDPAALSPLSFSASLSGDGIPQQLVALHDDGNNPDAQAGDGEYGGTATIPTTATGAFSVTGVVSGPGVASDERPWYGRVDTGNGGIDVIVAPVRGTVAPGGTRTTTLTADNRGAPRQVGLSLIGLPDGVLATITPATVTLPSGKSSAPVTLTFDRASRRDAPGGQIVVSEGNTVLGNGFLTVTVHTPPGPPWLLYGLLALLLATCAAGLALWLRFRKHKEAEVRGLTVTLLDAFGEKLEPPATAPEQGDLFVFHVHADAVTTVLDPSAASGDPAAGYVRRVPPKLLVTFAGTEHEVAPGQRIPLQDGRSLVIDEDRTTATAPDAYSEPHRTDERQETPVEVAGGGHSTPKDPDM